MYLENREQELRKSKLYNRTHPDRIRAIGRKSRQTRRARLAAAFVEVVDPMKVFERDKGICGICHRLVGTDWHVDHVIPIAKGGRHEYANVQLAHGQCNRSKGART
jgi:hypothetical protein